MTTTRTFNSITEIKQLNAETGHYWFSPDTMRFFNSQVHRGVLHGCYFITSEVPPYGNRRFTVRQANADGSIDTLGELCAHASYSAASSWLDIYLAEQTRDDVARSATEAATLFP